MTAPSASQATSARGACRVPTTATGLPITLPPLAADDCVDCADAAHDAGVADVAEWCWRYGCRADCRCWEPPLPAHSTLAHDTHREH